MSSTKNYKRGEVEWHEVRGEGNLTFLEFELVGQWPTGY